MSLIRFSHQGTKYVIDSATLVAFIGAEEKCATEKPSKGVKPAKVSHTFKNKKQWTVDDKRIVRTGWGSGKSVEQIAIEVGRTVPAVLTATSKFRLRD